MTQTAHCLATSSLISAFNDFRLGSVNMATHQQRSSRSNESIMSTRGSSSDRDFAGGVPSRSPTRSPPQVYSNLEGLSGPPSDMHLSHSNPAFSMQSHPLSPSDVKEAKAVKKNMARAKSTGTILSVASADRVLEIIRKFEKAFNNHGTQNTPCGVAPTAAGIFDAAGYHEELDVTAKKSSVPFGSGKQDKLQEEGTENFRTRTPARGSSSTEQVTDGEIKDSAHKSYRAQSS